MKKNARINICVLAVYCIFTFIFNWSCILGKNVMKWDVMDFYYPLSMLSADMLQNGKLPLWTASLWFGSPTYAMLVGPYWYPTTFFFEITTGYSLLSVALEYCIHLVIACYGAYLLIKEYIFNDDITIEKYVIAIIMGAFYGYSGLFVSCAEHLAIIISAAWLPYILLYVKKYCENKKMFYLLLASMFMGLSILGGYPEIWVATFIILIPYFVVNIGKYDRWYISIIRAARGYILFGIGTAMMAAIAVIPFLCVSRYVDRLGSSANIYSYNMEMFLSAIIPSFTQYATELDVPMDVSMISSYIGLITIVILEYALVLKLKNKWICIACGIFSVLMMLGNNAFLHPIFYKYFPLFKSLRFPSLWRCVLTVFVLILVAEALVVILSEKEKLIVFIKILVCNCVIFGGVSLITRVYYFVKLDDYLKSFSYDLVCDAICLFLYALVFVIIYKFRNKYSIINMLLVLSAFVEIFYMQQKLYPVTATVYDQQSDLLNGVYPEIAYAKFDMDNSRNHSIDYTDLERTKSGLDSTSIVMNHTLDEQGYLLVKLSYIQKYGNSVHCELASEVPEVFMTNDVVDQNDVEFDEWLEDAEVSPYQVYISDKAVLDDGMLNSEIDIQEFISGEINLSVKQDTSGYLVVQQAYYPGWKVAVDGDEGEIVKVNDVFLGVYLEPGEHQIEFSFNPVDFYVGAAITLVFVCILITACLVEVVKSINYIIAYAFIF